MGWFEVKPKQFDPLEDIVEEYRRVEEETIKLDISKITEEKDVGSDYSTDLSSDGG